jgi:hypothetical protein
MLFDHDLRLKFGSHIASTHIASKRIAGTRIASKRPHA